MNNTTRTHIQPSRAKQLLSAVRDDLRERRTVRAERRLLERDLASYTTHREVDDLLGALRSEDGAEAERMRALLARNIQHYQRTGLAS